MKKLVLVLLLMVWSTAYAANTVPFHATIDTAVEPGSCGATCVTLNITGSGRGSHLGSMTIEGPSVINLITGEQTGISTLTASDGSTIRISFSGVFAFLGPPGGDASFGGTWIMLSGTKRFARESGGGTYEGTASGNTGVLNIDGTLSNPGKK